MNVFSDNEFKTLTDVKPLYVGVFHLSISTVGPFKIYPSESFIDLLRMT